MKNRFKKIIGSFFETGKYTGNANIIDAKTGKKASNIYCKTCGAKMRPLVSSNMIDYRCPNEKWYSLRHLPIAYKKIEN